ncbi:hypothetical protein V3C99_000859 [Haemonchus contortus]|uniref:Cyclic nucleotide-binding domain-containing protein n=2 Tax=Haemonchus contortus TaxID=6289 RepID=A0A7I4YG02_HAECO
MARITNAKQGQEAHIVVYTEVHDKITTAPDLAYGKDEKSEAKYTKHIANRSYRVVTISKRLFDELIQTFRDISDASRAVLQLDTNIDILKISEDHPHVIHLRIETLEAQLEKLRLQFYLARAHLVILHRKYEGLVARGRLTPETWNLFLKEKHVDNHKQPLVLDPNQQGQLIANNLEFLGNYSTQLAGIRQTMVDENRAQYYDDFRRSQEAGIAEGTTFEREVLAALNAIYHKLQTKEPRTRGRNVRQLAETSEKTKDTHVLPVKRNTDGNIQEAEKITIHKNVEFMEVINIDDEELETREPNQQSDEGLVVLDEVESDEDDKRIVVVVEKTPETQTLKPHGTSLTDA